MSPDSYPESWNSNWQLSWVNVNISDEVIQQLHHLGLDRLRHNCYTLFSSCPSHSWPDCEICHLLGLKLLWTYFPQQLPATISYSHQHTLISWATPINSVQTQGPAYCCLLRPAAGALGFQHMPCICLFHQVYEWRPHAHPIPWEVQYDGPTHYFSLPNPSYLNKHSTKTHSQFIFPFSDKI